MIHYAPDRGAVRIKKSTEIRIAIHEETVVRRQDVTHEVVPTGSFWRGIRRWLAPRLWVGKPEPGCEPVAPSPQEAQNMVTPATPILADSQVRPLIQAY